MGRQTERQPDLQSCSNLHLKYLSSCYLLLNYGEYFTAEVAFECCASPASSLISWSALLSGLAANSNLNKFHLNTNTAASARTLAMQLATMYTQHIVFNLTLKACVFVKVVWHPSVSVSVGAATAVEL